MNWLNHLKSWAEVRRLLFITIPIAGTIWLTLDAMYNAKLERNMRDVHLEKSIVELNENVIEIQKGQKSLSTKFDSYVISNDQINAQTQRQITANQNGLIFSIEHQGEMTRSAMRDVVYDMMDVQKKTLVQINP